MHLPGIGCSSQDGSKFQDFLGFDFVIRIVNTKEGSEGFPSLLYLKMINLGVCFAVLVILSSKYEDIITK